jgi:hypothetical protein
MIARAVRVKEPGILDFSKNVQNTKRVTETLL